MVTVGIEERAGYWRLRLPRIVAKDSPRYISTGLKADPDNFKKVQRLAWDIEEDIETGNLDPTLERYKSHFKPKVTVAPKQSSVSLVTLWEKHSEFKKPQVAATTYKKDYLGRYYTHIKSLPTDRLGDAITIRDYLLATYSANTAQKVLVYISACCDWAVKSKLIKDNPFLGMAGDIRKPRGQKDIDPFSTQERDAIINAFQEHPTQSHYVPFIKFLFLTGCRTGEAIALKWQHINSDCTQIIFCESYDGQYGITKTTKTGVSRKFPCNPVLRELLLSIRPDDRTPDALVFTIPGGSPINNSRFTNQIWRGCRSGKKIYHGVIPRLVKEGKVDRYRCLYNTRHTFITQCLEAGVPIPQIARWVGNSPEVIMKHYAGCLTTMEVPIT
ncbi:tyrosine-type recombinase/integrase [Anabaena lutea]|uniref:Site-specific integrase n=1 Tax=Anabaena lutea FACHB-196 TaxID=2692881 RepID=A0ABR8FCM6_9NOST|nr:site-specific integrase [Anabaena lutea]MBD2566411.1 site-specific integrase [Anabaena lutea FACHB-196]